MKLLKDILYKSRIQEVVGSTSIEVNKVCFDSREVDENSVFVAVPGTVVDGHKFIDKTIEQGVKAIVCEVLPEKQVDGVTYVKVRNSAEALGYMASNFFDQPSKEITVIGVTGTNGKTSIVTMMFELFESLGMHCGLLSTVVNRIGEREIPATHTTSDAVKVQAMIREMVDAGCQYCFMEVSSHALDQYRVIGVEFDIAVFTNITHDHLDYHETFNNYIAAKRKLFDQLGSKAVAILNKDDRHWKDLVPKTKANVQTFSLKAMADYKGRIIENQFGGLHLNINGNELWTRLIGAFNASNLMALFSVAMALGMDELNVLTEISKISPAPGRFQQVKSKEGVIGIVDYAHTPDALKNVLDTISIIRTGNERVLTVVGCGGDRDRDKRPKMAHIAANGSDQVVITSDNPRSEDPQEIIKEMVGGLNPNEIRKTLQIVDRQEAIKTAVALSQPGDIILVAGKGHEKYQDIKGKRSHFDDVEILENLLNQ